MVNPIITIWGWFIPPIYDDFGDCLCLGTWMVCNAIQQFLNLGGFGDETSRCLPGSRLWERRWAGRWQIFHCDQGLNAFSGLEHFPVGGWFLWLVVWNIWIIFPYIYIYWEFHHPNWIFFRGVFSHRPVLFWEGFRFIINQKGLGLVDGWWSLIWVWINTY